MNDVDDPLRAARLGKLESLKAQGIDPYPYGFARTQKAADLERHYAGLAAGATITDSVDSTVFSGSSFTLTGAEVGSALTLHDGSNEGNFTLTVTANNTTAGEAASSGCHPRL